MRALRAQGHGPQLDQLDALAAHGRVVWGRVCTWDPALWLPGEASGATQILYSLDPFYERYPRFLSRPFEGLRRALETDGALRAMLPKGRRQILGPATLDVRGWRLPAHLTQGLSIRLSTVLVGRRQLPGRRLQGALVPIVTFPGEGAAASVLPAHLWPDWPPSGAGAR